MRFTLAATLLLGGLAACSHGPSETAPAAAPAMAQPAPAGPPPAMGAGGFDGHYVGTSITPGYPGCAREHDYDFTVANNEITGTLTIPYVATKHGHGANLVSDLSGHVDPSGKTVISYQPHGMSGGRGTMTGSFAGGQFTGHRGQPCPREVIAKRQ